MSLHREVAQLGHIAVPDLDDHLAKPRSLLVAIERHDVNTAAWTERPRHDQFVWIKAKSITVSKARSAYIARYEDPDLDITLKLDGWTAPAHFTLAQVCESNKMEARQFAFVATQDSTLANSHTHPPSSNASEAPTQPLLPTTPRRAARLSTTSVTPGHALSPTTRLPLQPVNRQVSVPSKSSQELKAAVAQASLSQDSQENAHPVKAAIPPPTAQSEVAPTTSAEGDHDQTYQAREQSNPFAASLDEEPDTVPRSRPLQQLTKESSPERLEAGVRAGLRALSDVVKPLQQLEGNADAETWLEQIEAVRQQAVRVRTVLGVVGNTGAGKSSIINAILEEERLVPTNCMRACTAVVTELSWNSSTDITSKYRAEIEFISPEDWRKELEILFEEVFDDSGNVSKDISSPDSTAEVAYAKIRAVYHKYTTDMLAKSSIDSLMRVKTVQGVLGKTKRISTRECSEFYKQLQQFVDSKEKGTQKYDKLGRKITSRKRDFEVWPLIKIVRIYVKADALSTGAVIVDLPGVHDSNAARAAVAEKYIQQCTGLWICAPINRAVDDKAAKSLLGNAFRRQLKYDGGFSAVTFVCTKVDDISRMEAVDSLKLGDQMSSLEEKLSNITRKKRALKAKIDTLEERKDNYSATVEQIEDAIEEWEALSDDLDDGKTVFAPSASGKRKRHGKQQGGSRQKKRRINFDSDNEQDEEYVHSEPEDNASASEAGSALTREQIDNKLDELKKLKREARRERINNDNELSILRAQMAPLDEEAESIDAQQNALCIAGRNEYSRSAIQQDFAAGIRELDQENAEEEHPDQFNPDEDLRDYEQVARDLPVFCVSSRAYQKLSGRLQKDNDVPGFETKEQTEIPQLQAHCKKLTEKGRQASCRRFANNLAQLMVSLELWSDDDGTGAPMSDQEKNAERVFLNRRLKELERALEKAVSETLADVKATLNENVFEKFAPAIQSAADLAVPTSTGWGARKDAGGLHWGTYKATVRRAGVFQGAGGLRDFNSELAEPLYKQLANAWEKAFQRRLPHILQGITKVGTDLLKQFHGVIKERCRQRHHGAPRVAMLENQLTAYQAIFGDLATAMIAQVNEGQREINREFTPVIIEKMGPAYDLCTEERGTGSFNRMKNHMTTHVSQHRTAMFTDATNQVKQSLENLCETIRKGMLDRADSIYLSMQRDYMSIIGGVNVNNKMSREERSIRRSVADALRDADSYFQAVLDAPVEELKDEGSGDQQEEDMMDAAELPDDAELFEDEDDTDDENGGEESEEAAMRDAEPGASHQNDEEELQEEIVREMMSRES